jgi:hypothetical protein
MIAGLTEHKGQRGFVRLIFVSFVSLVLNQRRVLVAGASSRMRMLRNETSSP